MTHAVFSLTFTHFWLQSKQDGDGRSSTPQGCTNWLQMYLWPCPLLRTLTAVRMSDNLWKYEVPLLPHSASDGKFKILPTDSLTQLWSLNMNSYSPTESPLTLLNCVKPHFKGFTAEWEFLTPLPCWRWSTGRASWWLTAALESLIGWLYSVKSCTMPLWAKRKQRNKILLTDRRSRVLPSVYYRWLAEQIWQKVHFIKVTNCSFKCVWPCDCLSIFYLLWIC